VSHDDYQDAVEKGAYMARLLSLKLRDATDQIFLEYECALAEKVEALTGAFGLIFGWVCAEEVPREIALQMVRRAAEGMEPWVERFYQVMEECT
jgi:hypothetical protein